MHAAELRVDSVDVVRSSSYIQHTISSREEVGLEASAP